MQKDALALYHKYHLDRADERLGMFESIAKHFDIERVLYPGSFVHATPSFVFPMVTYVDMEKRAKQFFTTPQLQQLIAQRKIYAQDAQVQFVHQDYATQLPERDESFDLLVSQYAGFISQQCKRYLKIGGWLLANNSHGDASMAHLDENYELCGVVKRRGDKFRFSAEDLEQYFVPNKDLAITKEYLEGIQRGIGYRKSAFAYVFVRTG